MRRQRVRGHATLDEGWLVWIGAAAAGADPHDVLAAADVAALDRVCADAEVGAADPWHRAAAVLLAIWRHRPFGTANAAAAFLGAADVLLQHGLRPTLNRADDVLDLLRTASTVEEVAHRLRRPSWASRPCPACGRRLRFDSRAMRDLVMVSVDRVELTARCWAEHRAHDRFGRPFVTPASAPVEPVRWRPVVRLTDDRDAFIVIADDGALLLDRGEEHDAFQVFRLEDVPLGVTSRDELARHGRAVATVAAAEVRFNEATGDVDLDRLMPCPS